MKSSWFARSVCAVLVLALGGCHDLTDDLGPQGDLELEGDGGRSLEPVVTTETKADSSVARQDAAVNPVTKDAAVHDADVDRVDAAASHEDAGDGPDGGGALGDAGDQPDPASFASVYALMAESCISCHGVGKTLDLSTPELAHAGLVNVRAQYTACVVDGGVSPVRVVAGNPEESLLIAKLEGTQTCGKQMPPRALLDAEKLASFRAWVAAGAPGPSQ